VAAAAPEPQHGPRPPSTEAPCVLVLSDRPMVRAGIAALLHSGGGAVTVLDPGGAGDPPPTVVAYDAGLLGRGGAPDLLQWIGRDGPAVLVIGEPDAECTRRALELGADHQVSEHADAAQLHQLVLDLTRGDTPVPSPRGRPEDPGLTSRELDVLRRITDGMSNQQIADDLFISLNSVKTYVRTAYRKLGISSRTQAVRWMLLHAEDVPEGQTTATDDG
jgi:DNA-binding NarL/FixJ family response regulator